MVKVIMGLKGEGKTKKLIELVKTALNEEHGDVVCIEKDGELTYDIPYQARLVKMSQYKTKSYEFLRGVICGLQAGNYDITHIFIDNLFKLSGSDSMDECERFLNWCDSFGARENVKFTITISADADLAPAEIKKYF